MESWKIAADIMARGGTVYAETFRYTTAPIWFNCLHFLDMLPGTGEGGYFALRYKIVIFLTCIDIVIFIILFRRFNLLVASLFFLNPISIIISGYHGQFENLAIIFGLIGVLLIQDNKINDSGPNKAWLLGIFFLGISLTSKHIFFLLPIWLALKERRWSTKLLMAVMPYAIFFGSFLPYWKVARHDIIKNVFLYRSYNNAPFWAELAPDLLLKNFSPVVLFLGVMIFLGLWWRKKSPLETYFLYSISVVIFSSAVANQYLVIPLAAIAVGWNIGYILFTLYSTLYLLVEWNGLAIGELQQRLNWQGQNGYIYIVFFLLMGLIIQLTSWKKIAKAWQWTVAEIKNQIHVPW